MGRLSSTTPDGTDVLDFWHGGGDRWRVERDGVLVYLSDGRTAIRRDVNDDMVPIDVRDVRAVWQSTGFGPTDLVGHSGLLHQMSSEVVAVSTPVETSHDGRPAWSTRLGLPGADEADHLTVVIDAESGLIVAARSERGGTLTVTGLSTEPIDDETFRVPTVHTAPAPVSDRQRIIDRLEILSVIDSAVEHREEVLAVIDASSTVDDARARIIDLLGVQEVGADAVLAMQLRRLVAVERDKISDEVASLRAHLAGHDE
ncbi:hypothetical protein ACH46_08375 [Gordonia phthalatica]|uniref:Uncharacterized protein n=2 Tax=Gordonia phthalatica TaxID=1136941 RepID=A0A0N7FUJ2_9ACTN|nr:hypothetical protein ACH46_08375 [Gordonia phthalatica]